MTKPSGVAALLVAARQGAGLSQRELARKARTAQSVVARIELGETSPSWATLTRLLKAAGYRLAAVLKRIDVDPVLLRKEIGSSRRMEALAFDKLRPTLFRTEVSLAKG